ncbi:MAG: hypothetical protein QOI66_765 [Myxococcales bacterium]|jgi:hypothetical protein|nr:hypothetical protein [Myxococcales bacterium]
MSHLVPCFSCQRHLRVTEERCPFCGVERSSEQRASAAPPLPGRRMGRAALFAFGATLMGAACSTTSGGADAGKDTAPADGAAGSGGSGGAGSGGSSGSGGAGSGGQSGTGGVTTNDGGGGIDGATDGAIDRSGTGGVAPPYGIAPLYGAPAPRDGK